MHILRKQGRGREGVGLIAYFCLEGGYGQADVSNVKAIKIILTFAPLIYDHSIQKQSLRANIKNNLAFLH